MPAKNCRISKEKFPFSDNFWSSYPSSHLVTAKNSKLVLCTLLIGRDLGFPRQENANSAASFCIFRDFTRKIRGKKYGIPRQIN